MSLLSSISAAAGGGSWVQWAGAASCRDLVTAARSPAAAATHPTFTAGENFASLETFGKSSISITF